MVIETVSSHLGPLLTKIPGVTPVDWRLAGAWGKEKYVLIKDPV